MLHPSSPKLVLLTPRGRGAIAALRVEGSGAVGAVARHFVARGGRHLAALPIQRLMLGHFRGCGGNGEEVIVRRVAEDVVELNCHGGVAVVEMIEQTLAATGCRIVLWQDWIAEHEEDSIAAAARIALAQATTQRTAAILLDQYRGALRREIGEIETLKQLGDIAAARQRIDALLALTPLGKHLTAPWQVVVAGWPNVGKSSLINAVAGYRRAIVHSTPGTTRDVVSVQVAMEGWPVELSDTAGLRQDGDAIERAGMELAQRRLANADLVVLVFDQSQPWSAAEEELAAQWPQALVVHNKGDLPADASTRPVGPIVSAVRSEGIEELCRAIARRLVPEDPPLGSAVPFTTEQVSQTRDILG